LSALNVTRKYCPHVPFIFISGTIGEEAAVEALKKGATDYILKDRLGRLPSAIQRALDEVNDRNRAKALEQSLKKHEDQLRQFQKLESIGQLVGGIAHDFNNLLTVINGRSQMLLSGIAADNPVREEIEVINQAGERAAALTRQLLTFSRKQKSQPKLINLNVVISDLIKLLDRIIGKNIHITLDLLPTLQPILADPNQIEQILFNLTGNSRDAMPNGGIFRITTTNTILNDQTAAQYPSLQPGEYVCMTVADSGMGMDEEIRRQIFEPFFTTKPEGKGTGLGLSTVYGIVKHANGYVTVTSEVGKGTSFILFFPAANGPVQHEVIQDQAVSKRKAGETILIVEDDPHLQEFIADAVASYGYIVLLASNGLEALTVATNHSGPIEMVITDVIMPKMSGSELVSRIFKVRPDIKLILCSGYGISEIGKGVLDQPNVTFLQKPYSVRQLIEQVQTILSGKA
jgi:signal transduction histidine kinase